MGLIVCDQPCTVAGVFTRNSVKAAPVMDCVKKVRCGVAQAVLVNSGNANACTGKQGLQSACLTCSALAKQLGIKKERVLPCSTGVIGVPLPHDKIIDALAGSHCWSISEAFHQLCRKHYHHRYTHQNNRTA